MGKAFSKAIKHLKSTEIDDRIAVLEAAPTNNTTFINVPDADMETETAPSGLADLDFDNDDPAQNGKDTSGLFEADGTPKTVMPPGDTSYILGPMTAMYYTWYYPWTMIGYIRMTDRKMVNLARIDGKLSDWDGVSNFNSASWGGQLTVAQARWFRDTPKKDDAGNDPADANYRSFYPGPPSNTPDSYGRYLCTITGTPKTETKTAAPIGQQAGDNFSAMLALLKKKLGKQTPQKDDFDREWEEAIKVDVNNIDQIYKDWKRRYDQNFHPDGTAKTPFNTNAADYLPPPVKRWFKNNVPDWRESQTGQWIEKNSWWIEPVIGAVAGAVGARNAYKMPYGIKTSRINAWKSKIPTRNPQTGKLDNLQLFNKNNDLIGKKVYNPKTKKWDIKMRPNQKSSTNNKIDWEIDQLQHTDKSFTRYEKTGRNPGYKDLDPMRLTRVDAPGSTAGGGTVGANWAIQKGAGAAVGAGVGSVNRRGRRIRKESVSEDRKKDIIKNLKEPVVIPETKQKSYKVRPKVPGLSNTPKIASATPQKPYKDDAVGGRNQWGKHEYDANVRMSQERMNSVYDMLGGGWQAFEHMLLDKKIKTDEEMEDFWGKHPELYSYFYDGKKYKVTRKEQFKGDMIVFMEDENGEKSTIFQSVLNEKLAEEYEKKELAEYNKLEPYEKDSLFKKSLKSSRKEIAPEYPKDPPPEMVNDRHPDFGKRPGFYRKLDPVSAIAMPKTGDSETDAEVKKAKVKPKVKEEYSDWKKALNY